VPVDTHRARLKATQTVTVTGGAFACVANPIFGLCSDFVPTDPALSPAGVFNYAAATSVTGVGSTGILTNAQYARAQFAGLTNNSSVRGRVVSACIRICNVSAANTRNGVFTLFTDQQHNTLQGKTAGVIATDQKAAQYNASTPDWHTLTYHPVEPDEVESWVWDPARGPQGGVKTGAYQTGNAADGTSADNFPGYMGIWWVGDAVSQTFQIEMYIIAEYVGSLVQPLVRDVGVTIDDAQEAAKAAEAMPVHIASPKDGASHSGHPPLLDALKGLIDRIPKPIRDAAQKRAEDYVVGKLKGGISKKMQTAAILMAPEFAPEIAAGGMIARRAMPYAAALGRAAAKQLAGRPYGTRPGFRGPARLRR
jgi:hypothetical protein